MIDSQLLSYLIVFSETGSLLKSSEILHLSQPSLSKAMQNLKLNLILLFLTEPEIRSRSMMMVKKFFIMLKIS